MTKRNFTWMTAERLATLVKLEDQVRGPLLGWC